MPIMSPFLGKPAFSTCAICSAMSVHPPFPIPLWETNADWTHDSELQRLVLVVAGLESKQVLERWAFNLETDKSILMAQ